MTNRSLPTWPTQGLDMTMATIDHPTRTPTLDLPAGGPARPGRRQRPGAVGRRSSWGYNFQVQAAAIENLGQVASGPFNVRFLLTGTDGSLDSRHLPRRDNGLRPAAGQLATIIQTVHLPNKLPNGVTLDSTGVGRVAVVVDPDNVFNESNPIKQRRWIGPGDAAGARDRRHEQRPHDLAATPDDQPADRQGHADSQAGRRPRPAPKAKLSAKAQAPTQSSVATPRPRTRA